MTVTLYEVFSNGSITRRLIAAVVSYVLQVQQDILIQLQCWNNK
jgi:hypothetical protein